MKHKIIKLILITICFWIFIPICNAQEADTQVDSVVTLTITGDLMLGGRFTKVMNDKGIDYPFENIASHIKSADVAYCNMEPPFSVRGKPVSKQYVYHVPPKHSKVFKNAGFDVVALANNHIMDFGVKALETTFKTLDYMGIKHCGAGLDVEQARKPVIMDKKGVKLGFLSYSKTFPFSFYADKDKAGTAPGFEQYLRKDIPELCQKVDFVFVSFHWASILQKSPKNYQTYLARLSINLGADVVIGHHPYTIQPIELYKDGVIFYTVGKLAFGSLSNSLQESLLLQFNINKEQIKSISVLSVQSNNKITNFQPTVMDRESAEEVLTDLLHRSNLTESEKVHLKDGRIIIDL